MSSKLATLLLATVMMGGCATVDLNDMTSTTSQSQAQKPDVNVVQKAVAKLHAAFSTKGFVESDSRKKMQKAAKILLKGLEEKDIASGENPNAYANRVQSRDTVLSDIQLATHHVEQTTKAAEIYLAMASDDASLRDELGSLEKALLMSHEAESVFETTLKTIGGTSSSQEWTAFRTSLDELNAVTDKFGEQVRANQTVNLSQIF